MLLHLKQELIATEFIDGTYFILHTIGVGTEPPHTQASAGVSPPARPCPFRLVLLSNAYSARAHCLFAVAQVPSAIFQLRDRASPTWAALHTRMPLIFLR